MELLGGFTSPSDATDEIQAYCDQLKSQVEEKAGTSFNVYEAKTYQSQVVAGMNYIVKVYVGNGDYILLKIYQALDNTLELTAVEWDPKEHHELTHFEAK